MINAKIKFSHFLSIDCLIEARKIACDNLSKPMEKDDLIAKFEGIARTFNHPQSFCTTFGEAYCKDDKDKKVASMLYYLFIDNPIRGTELYKKSFSISDVILSVWTLLVTAFPEFKECARIIGKHLRKELADEQIMEIYNRNHEDSQLSLWDVLAITDTMRGLHGIIPLKYGARANRFLYPKQVSQKIDTPIPLTHESGAYFKGLVETIYYSEADFPPSNEWLNAWFPFRELWCFWDKGFRGRLYQLGKKYLNEQRIC